MDRYEFIVRILQPTVLVLVVAATTVLTLKGKRVLAIAGSLTAALSLWIVVTSWNSQGGLEDLGPLIVFGYVVLPLAVVLTVAAFRLPRPGSWWWLNRSTESARRKASERYSGPTRPSLPGPTSPESDRP